MADFWARVILVIGAIGSAFAFWKVTKAGIEKDKENEIKADQSDDVLSNVLKSTKANEDAENLSESEIDDSLRDNGWMRDD